MRKKNKEEEIEILYVDDDGNAKKHDPNKKFKINLKILLPILIFLVALFVSVVVFGYTKVKAYDKKTFPNVFLQNYNLSNLDMDELDKKLDQYSTEILNSKIIFVCGGKEFTYTYKDMGLSINKKQIVNNILNYQANLSYSDKILTITKKIKKVYNYEFSYSEDNIVKFVNGLKAVSDSAVVNGGIVVDSNRNVSYNKGSDGFSLNVDKSVEIIEDNIKHKFTNTKVELVGDVTKASGDDSLASINTKTSSFITEFDTWITARATNLRTALAYIDGAIVKPGETFSYYSYAGPYNKKGYVFYYEFVGNGVCQIATTTYNAALLGGLEIVKRYPHDKKSVYVAGGLDATVASYGSWNVDMQWKNTYSYPIYVSAYAVGGVAHVDFWSNANATEGKTYTMESVYLGGRHYISYRHIFKDGVEIGKEKIAETWYPKA